MKLPACRRVPDPAHGVLISPADGEEPDFLDVYMFIYERPAMATRSHACYGGDREECTWHSARSSQGTWHHRSDEQVKFPPLSCHCHPSAGHALPDLRPHCRIPPRQDQRGPDRALPPGPSRKPRPPLPIAGHRDPARLAAAPRPFPRSGTTLGCGGKACGPPGDSCCEHRRDAR